MTESICNDDLDNSSDFDRDGDSEFDFGSEFSDVIPLHWWERSTPTLIVEDDDDFDTDGNQR